MKLGKRISLDSFHGGVFIVVVAISLSLLLVPSAQARTPQPDGLFQQGGEEVKTGLPARAIQGKSRRVKINRKKLRRNKLFIRLPGGVSFEAVRQELVDLGDGRMAWIGHASDDPDNRVVLGVSGRSVTGTFSYGGKLFKLEPRKKGRHIVSEVEPGDPAPELDPIAVQPDLGLFSDGLAGGGGAAAPVGGAEIDVLVAYTPRVVASYGSVAGVESMIIQAVAETNQAYLDSQMTTRINLVHMTQLEYVESGMSTDLSRLRGNGDGYMDEIHALRDAFGADLVNLIEHEPRYCGLAYLMNSPSPGFAPYGFSVVHHSCATGYYSFGHELGHNQGAHHDINSASGSPAYAYSYGYQDPNALFRTIMAYNCSSNCTRVGLFSSGDNQFFNLATGVPGAADNALSIDQTAPIVASFRNSAITLPAAPSGLLASVEGIDQVRLDWTDNASNEAEFLVERSEDGLNFSQVASLPENTESYSDTGLSPETFYSYRVRARNSQGASGYTDTISIMTEELVLFRDHFAIAELASVGLVTGSRVDIQEEDGISETIQEVDAGTGDYSLLEHSWAFDVSPGQTVTVFANVNASTSDQSFVFSYSTEMSRYSDNPEAWIDMFAVHAGNAGTRQFTLPDGISGPVFVAVHDSDRAPGQLTADSVDVDYLMIRTDLPTGLPPGC